VYVKVLSFYVILGFVVYCFRCSCSCAAFGRNKLMMMMMITSVQSCLDKKFGLRSKTEEQVIPNKLNLNNYSY